MKRQLKDSILRYFESGQLRLNGSFYQTKDMLHESNLFDANDATIAFAALDELVADNLLIYTSASYYLQGYAPTI